MIGEVMELKERLARELKESLKSGDKLKVSTIRLIISEVKNAEIEKRDELSEDELLSIVAREAKRRREAIGEFEKGGRQDLVDKEKLELKVIEGYLPEQLSEDELLRIIEETIDEVGASCPGDLGKVMGKVMPRIKGRADGKRVNQIVRNTLEQT